MDHAFGKLMRTLDELKLTDNTVVFFTSRLQRDVLGPWSPPLIAPDRLTEFGNYPINSLMTSPPN